MSVGDLRPTTVPPTRSYRSPRTSASRIAPLAIGGILFGLDWAYQTRPYSDGLGVTLLLVSSLVLLAGGLIGVRSGRHPEPPPLV